MALQSKLFAGDSKLEAAATTDSAHIAQGSIGDHVAKIQQALIQLDGAAISADGNYGPRTANAVLAYKTKRSIINRAYQSQADNIVGRMTMAALDREMLEKENKLEPTTCRLDQACPCDVVTLPVVGPSVRLNFAISESATPVGQAATPGDIMRQARRDSISSQRRAIRAMEKLIRALMAKAKGKGDLTDEDKRVFKAVTRWLNLRTRPDQIAAIAHMASAIALMNRNINIKTSTGADPTMVQVTGAFHGQAFGSPDRGMECGTDACATAGL
jgi:hypothetical protein